MRPADGLVVREVVTLGPADIEGGIAPGDRITSVDGVAITPTTNLDALLESDVDRRVDARHQRHRARSSCARCRRAPRSASPIASGSPAAAR